MAPRRSGWAGAAHAVGNSMYTAHKGYKVAKAVVKGLQLQKKQRAAMARGTAVTLQRDVVSTYKKRGPGKKVLAKKRRFRNKLQRAIAPISTHHTYTEVQAVASVVTNFANGSQITYQYPSLTNSEVTTLNGGTDNPLGISYMKDQLYNLDSQTSAVKDGAQTDANIHQKSLHVLGSKIDVSLSNISGTALIFDLYWCVATCTSDDATHATPIATWTNLALANSTMTVAGIGTITKMVPTDNGATPHSAPGFGKYWKILEKKRVYIASGGTSEFSYNGGSYFYNPQKFVNQSIVAGRTKALMIVGGIGDNTGTPTTAGPPAAPIYRYHTTRTYRVKYPFGKDQLPGIPTNTTLRV